MDGLLLYFIALTGLILLSAFFSGSEAALFSLTRSQLVRLEGQSAAGREIVRQLKTPRRLLITILIGNLLVNVFATSAATSVAVSTFGDSGVVYAFAFMSVLILIAGETLPKVIAIHQPQRTALFSIILLRLFHTIFTPVQIPIAYFTDRVIAFVQRRIGRVHRSFSEEELQTAFDIGHDEGMVGVFEHELLSNIIEFRNVVVREIMTPSISVFSLHMELDRPELEARLLDSGHSRAPLYGDTPDDVRGILHVKDLATYDEDETDVRELLRQPYYVPESTRISDLFRQLGAERSHFAVVIDEYGSYVGIVTMEDILEEIVGEIRDANESQTVDHTLLDENRIVVLGRMELDVFNSVFGTRLEDDEHETIAGYLIGHIGRIPNAGENVSVGDLNFHVISAEPNRIHKMRVEKP